MKGKKITNLNLSDGSGGKKQSAKLKMESIKGSTTVTIRYFGRAYKKEFCININTNYIEYPNITFYVPSNVKFDEELKTASNILS